MRLRYEIRMIGREPIRGERELAEGENRLILPLDEGELEAVTARIPVALGETEKIFMNGYQTWTYSPEHGRLDYTKGVGPLPELLIRGLGIRSYGDYDFVDYPRRPGLTHGESWCYFREGETFRLFASLDERPGYTLFSYDVASGLLTVQRDCRGLRCCGDFHALDLYYGAGEEKAVFDGWFRAMGVKPRTQKRLAGYTSWYNRYQDISEQSIKNDLLGCVGRLSPGNLFQIDDGWEPRVGDWLEADRKKFPKGMKAAAAEIHDKGFQAGLWLAPFVAQRSSRLFREHPDWFLQKNGRHWLAGIGWGGFYALDIDKPQVIEYLERVFHRVLDEWSYDLVKLDFLYAAAPFAGERETRAGRMIRAMELLRRLCGEKLMLGCGVPLMPAFGLADYCRIGCDVSLDWDNTVLMRRTNRERPSTRQAIRDTIFRRQLNGRAFLSDPDVFFLREENLKLNEKQKRTLAAVNALFGGVLLHSDDMSRWSREAEAFYQKLLRLRDAERICVHSGYGPAVSYTLDGREETLEID